MEKSFSKVNNEIKVTKSEVVERTYSLDYLKKQWTTVFEQRERELAQRNAELAEIDELIAEAEKMGLVEEVKEPVIDMGRLQDLKK
jgi:hypothetical protein